MQNLVHMPVFKLYTFLDRFHGAFTGGFSAGYFNSVGTKEGWTPSTFVSSKGQRAETKRARPQDFMDDEVSARNYISLSTVLLKCPSIVHMSLDVLVVPFCYGYLTCYFRTWVNLGSLHKLSRQHLTLTPTGIRSRENEC